MKDYKISIKVSDVGGIYNADNIEEANEIAQSYCDEIYARLKGKATVEIESIEEIKK